MRKQPGPSRPGCGQVLITWVAGGQQRGGLRTGSGYVFCRKVAADNGLSQPVHQQSALWTTPGLLEAPQPGEDGAMSNPRYTAEMRERAVKMVMQVRRESGQEKGAVARVAQQLGIGREALRGWVAQAEVDSGARPGTTSDDKQRIKELERENSELRRANEILKAASAYFARELGPSLPR